LVESGDIIYTESLVYLFRVLFLLYADHRNLFKHRKVETVFYQLLDKIDSYNQIGNIPEGAENISDKNDDYDINGVFEEIDREFNGGLFSIKLHTILNRFDIDNILYANAIDNLTRTLDKKTERPQRVDFSVLEVRHLGTIYEGLLEYKLKKTTEEITIPLLSDKNKTRKLLKGDLFLVNDKGERKATGSYYTPDYIVECIVKNTVGPLIDAIEKESISIQEKILKILALRILDPAMGSGHFLVEVISYINDRIEALIQTELEEYANKPGRKSKAQTELENLLKDAEFGFYKRIIAKKCIYGVDKNPMAVELAKLSIWIYTLQRNKKLEFFDYNLRCGDSLIGSQEKTFSSQLDSQSKERMLFANNEELYKNVVEDFKEEFKKYFELENVDDRMKYYESTIKPNQQKLKYLANIELAIAFANKNDEIHSIYNAHKNKLLGIIRLDKTNEYLKKLIQGKNLEDWELKLFQAAKKIRKDYNPIHWELDFPNVFIDRGGFDGIVGNPPYVRVQNLNYLDTDFFFKTYTTPTGKIDISILFFELGFRLINSFGILSYIASSQWMQTDYGKNLRDFFSVGYIQKIIDFGSLPVFSGADTYPAILIINKEINKKLLYSKVKNINELNIHSINRLIFNEIEYKSLGKSSWNLSGFDLINKLNSKKIKFVELGKVGKAYIGLLTGYDEAFVVNSEIIKKYQLEYDILVPYSYRGNEIQKYSNVTPAASVIYPYKENNEKAILIEEKVLKKEYPNCYSYLYQFISRLTTRMDSRKYYAQNDQWFRHLRSGTFHYIKASKLIFKGVDSKSTVGLLSERTAFNGANCPAVIIEDKTISELYILCFLNSSLISYYLNQICPKKLGGFIRINAQNISKIPIIISKNQEPFIKLAETMLTNKKELQEIQNKFSKLLQSDLKIEKLTEKLIAWNKLSWEDFLAELMKKKIELKLNQKAEWMDFFEKEKAKANAIEEVITKTDSEIDLMVYNLYGLTEEEIKIVEGGV